MQPADFSLQMRQWALVTNLKFDGERFEDHSFEFDVAQELTLFQRIVTELAKQVYYNENPNRDRIPKGFEQLTRLRFRTVGEGSALLPTETLTDNEQSLFGGEPSRYVAQAIDMIQAAIQSQEEDAPGDLPLKFPREFVGDLARLGSSLFDNERLIIADPEPNGKRAATITKASRERLAHYNKSFYEDILTLYGEVRAADLDRSSSRIRLGNQFAVEVRFLDDQADFFRNSLGAPVRLSGLAEISRVDGALRRIKSVLSVDLTKPSLDAGESIGEWISEYASDADWSEVPLDYAKRLDEYLYGDVAE